ncbi:hypothetical protein Bca4012_074441 [Brassica carinata]
MDSTNPYSQYRSYVGLLNSQRENVVHQNFSYESFPSSANLGSSEIPPLSSQQSEAPAVPEDTPAERRERKKWSPADDEKRTEVTLSRHCGQLSDKVDYLTSVSDYDTQLNQVKELHYETEQKLVSLERIVCDLAKKKFRFGNGFQLVVGFMVVVLGIIAMVLLIK